MKANWHELSIVKKTDQYPIGSKVFEFHMLIWNKGNNITRVLVHNVPRACVWIQGCLIMRKTGVFFEIVYVITF